MVESVDYIVPVHVTIVGSDVLELLPHTDCPYLPIAKRAFFGTEGFFLPLKMRAL